MTKTQKKWIKRWENKRRKGFVNYIMIQTLMIGGGVISGKLIGVALFTNQRQWGEFFASLPTVVITILVVSILLNSLAWCIGERRYKNLINQQEHT
ncbi:hypothetical protein [Aliivibrio fischeri]|uniref:Uncharacterized protein n=1 Tax=Aliivibrio fischeri SR5 TaxID=1088719 RepID=A0AAV3EMK6_ALIFS|nr:hypothetical protein [Aliivibrio fischeri]EHN68037.1 hypothetical protein VFSR5_A0618 [Aliivibrio fischeri SR5]